MLQGNLFLPKPAWAPPAVSTLPSWSGAARICVDIETHDPQLRELGPGVRRDGYICGVAIAVEDGPSFYLPIAHQGGDNLDREQVLAYLRDNAAEFSGVVVGTNLPYDLDYLESAGVTFPKAKWFRDVQIAEPLIDELQDHYNLDAIARRYSLPGKDDQAMLDAVRAFGLRGHVGQHIWRLPARYVHAYATQDVKLPLKLLRMQERLIDEQDLQNIWDLESKLMPVLLRMRRRGVRFSHDRLAQVEAWSVAEEQKALDEIHRETGYRIGLGEVWGTEPFERALGEIGITPPKTDKGAVSITTEWLSSVKHAVADLMIRARKVNKLRTTFVQSIRNYAVGDRIHCGMNQLRRERDDGGLGGAAFGRLSSEHPNMQQQPARDPEIGPMWRSIYLPDDGGQWACLDYSQQEPRLLTHYADMCQCPGAADAAKRYRDDPTTDNHTMMAQLTGLPRKQAKNIFLGLCYGMGPAKLARECGLPTEWVWSEKHKKMVEVAGPEGKAMLDRFNERVPYVRALQQQCEVRAKERGYLSTLLGRRCRFPRKEGGGAGFDWTHKALNRLIQGGSADQTKAAMVAADAAGYKIQLQVHDELDLTVQDAAQAEQVAHIMRTVVELRVPSKVDVEVGPSWGELK